MNRSNTNRKKIADKLIDYLEARINCDNVLNYTSQYATDEDDNILIIDNFPVALNVVEYNDNQDYHSTQLSDKKDNTEIKKMYEIFDFMVESNYTGFEYFPYLYGVLDCHDSDRSRIYIYRENFEADITKLIASIDHPSDWYDVVFQIIMIDDYVKNISKYDYKPNVINFLYNKLSKPFYKEYTFGETKLNINHKYLIVLWDYESINTNPSETAKSNLDFLLEYINEKQSNIRVQPSNRIIKMINNIKNDPTNLSSIIIKYYGPTEPAVS
ncbi:hypothetical protein QLL95_gp1248 [Cotonvirus japonicus]|uniref:Uncharacterized protein n=1 Tax=Cotonvirus japonicus TaxID=2811091 RepID=A0ABM7NRT4_9VIRU|nr:hypothetical protein QLL95_gp1248 [Cotonvirus japonicus]BCS82875.1 hypothetical protein [Cotonvirus japonicus]